MPAPWVPGLLTVPWIKGLVLQRVKADPRQLMKESMQSCDEVHCRTAPAEVTVRTWQRSRSVRMKLLPQNAGARVATTCGRADTITSHTPHTLAFSRGLANGTDIAALCAHRDCIRPLGMHVLAASALLTCRVRVPTMALENPCPRLPDPIVSADRQTATIAMGAPHATASDQCACARCTRSPCACARCTRSQRRSAALSRAPG